MNNKRDVKPLSTDDLPIEGLEGEPLSVLSASELKERAEFEERTGLDFDSHVPKKRRRDEICETFGSTHQNYVESTQLTEAGTSTVIHSINIGKFHTGEGRGFNVGPRTGFHILQGKGFSSGTGVGFSSSSGEGFDIKFNTAKEAFDPDGFDTAIDPEYVNPTICNFPLP